MIFSWPICVAVDFEGIVFFIIFIFIVVGNILKAIKKGASGTTSRSPQASENSADIFTSSQDELQNFLKSIGAPQTAQQAPQPPKPPPPPPPASRRRSFKEERPKPIVQEYIRRPAVPPPAPKTARQTPTRRPPKALPQEKHALAENCDDYGFHFQDKTVKLNKLRLALGSDLIKPTSMQKAILLQEILNQPLALRKQ